MATKKDKSQGDKNFIDYQPGGESTLATYKNQSNVPFVQRVALSDDKTRSRYNAVKNALMAYYVPANGEKVRPEVDEYGEKFYLGAKLLAEVRLVRGYVRLFLALKPSKYPLQRYHHNDYSRVRRYADCPLEINICNADRVKNAYSLIAEVMRREGAVPEKSVIALDFSADFDGALSAQVESFNYADMAAADKIISDADIREDQTDPPAEPVPEGPFYGEPAQGGRSGDIGDRTDGRGYNYSGAIAPAPVKLPRRAKVVDAEGKKTGVVRGGVWYDLDYHSVGEFRRSDDSVYLYDGEHRKGFLDRNDNVISLSYDYMASLRRFPVMAVLILVIFLAIATILSGVIGVFYIQVSKDLYAPVLFIADDKNISWDEQENLDVFYNGTFGEDKIAPGMTGSYAFVLSNRNEDALEFALEFSCENEYGIELVYSLWRDGACISGGAGKLPAEQLSVYNMTIEAQSDSVFVLEWEWRHNDPADTTAGQNGAVYTLNITFTAAVQGT